MFYRSTRNPKYTYLENLIITLWFITQIAPEKSQSTKGPSFVWLLLGDNRRLFTVKNIIRSKGCDGRELRQRLPSISVQAKQPVEAKWGTY
jgi:hypothetical protein